MAFVSFLIMIIVFGFLGWMAWTTSELPLALKEIALNTRKEGAEGKEYTLINICSVLIKIGAVLIWVLGLILAVVTLFAADAFSDLLKLFF